MSNFHLEIIYRHSWEFTANIPLRATRKIFSTKVKKLFKYEIK